MSEENQTPTIDTTSDPEWLEQLANSPTNKKSVFNRAAVKRHFLAVSKQTRAGKFNRVSSEAIEKLEVAFEAKLKSFLTEVTSTFGQVEPTEVFLTGHGKEKVLDAFNVWLAREMHRQVNQVRVGKTI